MACEAGGGGAYAAGGVHLLLRRLVMRKRPAATPFCILLRRAPARLRLCGRSAVRRSPALPVVGLDGPVGAAHEQLGDIVSSTTARGII